VAGRAGGATFLVVAGTILESIGSQGTRILSRRLRSRKADIPPRARGVPRAGREGAHRSGRTRQARPLGRKVGVRAGQARSRSYTARRTVVPRWAGSARQRPVGGGAVRRGARGVPGAVVPRCAGLRSTREERPHPRRDGPVGDRVELLGAVRSRGTTGALALGSQSVARAVGTWSAGQGRRSGRGTVVPLRARDSAKDCPGGRGDDRAPGTEESRLTRSAHLVQAVVRTVVPRGTIDARTGVVGSLGGVVAPRFTTGPERCPPGTERSFGTHGHEDRALVRAEVPGFTVEAHGCRRARSVGPDGTRSRTGGTVEAERAGRGRVLDRRVARARAVVPGVALARRACIGRIGTVVPRRAELAQRLVARPAHIQIRPCRARASFEATLRAVASARAWTARGVQAGGLGGRGAGGAVETRIAQPGGR